jgi:hypothetical protein
MQDNYQPSKPTSNVSPASIHDISGYNEKENCSSRLKVD